jgi:hypothetical protein
VAVVEFIDRETSHSLDCRGQLRGWEEQAMTTVERWRRGLFGAIAFVIGVALVDYFFPPAPMDPYGYYFAIGLALLLGYLGGSRDERKSNRVHVTS